MSAGSVSETCTNLCLYIHTNWLGARAIAADVLHFIATDKSHRAVAFEPIGSGTWQIHLLITQPVRLHTFWIMNDRHQHPQRLWTSHLKPQREKEVCAGLFRAKHIKVLRPRGRNWMRPEEICCPS